MISLKNFKIIESSDKRLSKITKHDPTDFDKIIHNTPPFDLVITTSGYPLYYIRDHLPINNFMNLNASEKMITKEIADFLNRFVALQPETKYYIFYQESCLPGIDDYVKQWRIVSDFAMKYAFRIKPLHKTPVQPANIDNFLYHLLTSEKTQINFAIENSLYGIYRIWS